MQLETIDGGLLRISDPQADVVIHYHSGDRRMFSPDGKRLLFESRSQRYVLDLSEPHIERITKALFGHQFNHESKLVELPSEAYVGPIGGMHPTWEGWFPGGQDGDRILYAVHRAYYSKINQPWTLCLFDSVTDEVIEQFTFRHAMPGATWAGRPHDLRYIPEEETWACQLSAYANPGWHRNAIYAFDRDGSSARKLAGSEKWSHPTFSANTVAYGLGNDYCIADWRKGHTYIRESLSDSYGHGTLIADRLALSNARRFVNEHGVHRARDIQVVLVDSGPDPYPGEVIRNIPNPTDLYAHRARPTISHDGTKVAWNEEHGGFSSVMVWSETPEESEVEKLRTEVEKLRTEVESLRSSQSKIHQLSDPDWMRRTHPATRGGKGDA